MDQQPRSLQETNNQLGTPIAVRRAPTFLLLIDLFLCGLWFSICLAAILFILLIFLADLFNGKLRAADFGMLLLILGFFGALTFLAGKQIIRAWRGLSVCVHVFPEGIIYTRWRRVVAYRWEDIFAFSYRAIDHMHLGITYLYSTYYYRFRHHDGHHFLFVEKLNRNVEKPIAQFVEEGLLDRELLLLRESFLQHHEEIDFGPFTLGLEGLGYKRALLPWPEVDFIWAEDGRVRVRKKGKTLNWCSARMDNVPNMCLFLALVKERLAQEESRQ